MKMRPAAAIIAWLAIALAAHSAAAAENQHNRISSYLRQGVQSVCNLDHTAASSSFRRVVDLDPENPEGYAFLALAKLFSYETSFDSREREKILTEMIGHAAEASERGEKRIERNPRDRQALSALIVVKIVRIRLALMQKSHLTVARESANLWDIMERARAVEPGNYDLYFPMGLLHYHIDQLPGVTRFLSSLLITKGNHHRGIEELELAMQKGDLFRELAQAELSSVYMNFEKQPARALPLTVDLRERFPRNYGFSFSLANIFSELGRFDEAYEIAGDIEKKIKAGAPPFAPQLQPRYENLLGRILFNQREYDRSGELFQRTLKVTEPYNARVRASSLMRLGMIHDVRLERKRAEEYYNRALDVEGGEGVAQVEARRYLKTPYTNSSNKGGS